MFRIAIERCLTAIVFACAVVCPAGVSADDAIDPTLIPDGTYPAHVDRVISPQRMTVTMQGTLKIFLDAARADINFNEKVKANHEAVVTLVAGKVTALVKK